MLDWRLIYSSVVTDEDAVVGLDITDSTIAAEPLDARNHVEKTIEIKFPTECGILHGTTEYHRKFAPETKLATSVHIIDLGKIECWTKRCLRYIARAQATGKVALVRAKNTGCLLGTCVTQPEKIAKSVELSFLAS